MASASPTVPERQRKHPSSADVDGLFLLDWRSPDWARAYLDVRSACQAHADVHAWPAEDVGFLSQTDRAHWCWRW
jgi:hypothetical protein